MSRGPFHRDDGTIDAEALLKWQLTGKTPEKAQNQCPSCGQVAPRVWTDGDCEACGFPSRRMRAIDWASWQRGDYDRRRAIDMAPIVAAQQLEASMMTAGLIVRSRLEAREIRWVIGGSGGGGGCDAAPAVQPRSPAATWPMQVHEGIAAAGLWLCDIVGGL